MPSGGAIVGAGVAVAGAGALLVFMGVKDYTITSVVRAAVLQEPLTPDTPGSGESLGEGVGGTGGGILKDIPKLVPEVVPEDREHQAQRHPGEPVFHQDLNHLADI